MQTPKLICTDVDGTLVTKDFILPETNRLWIQRVVREKQIPLAIVSGRFRASARPVAEQLGVPVDLCCFNGAYVQSGDEVLYDKPIPVELVHRMLPVIRKEQIVIQLFGLDDWYTEENDGFWYDKQVVMSGKEGTIGNLDDILDRCEREGKPIYKLTPRSLDTQKVGRVIASLKERMGDDLDVFLSSPYIIETAPKGMDKANVIPILATHYAISPQEVMAFGDYDNDLGMLKASGFPVAMGNARPALKEVAKLVTDDVAKGGVGNAIHKIFFGE